MKNRIIVKEQLNPNLNNRISLIKRNLQKPIIKSLSPINNYYKSSNILNNNKNKFTPLIYKDKIIPYMTKQKLIIKNENSLNMNINNSFNKFKNNFKNSYTLLDNEKIRALYLLRRIKLNKNPKKLKILKNPLQIYINTNLNKRNLFNFSKKLGKNCTEKILIPQKFIKILNKKTIKKSKKRSVESQVNIDCDSKIPKRKYSLNNIFDMVSQNIENSRNKIRVNTILRRNDTDINLQLNKGKQFFISEKRFEEEDEEEKNNIHLKLQNILGYESAENKKINDHIKSKEKNKKTINVKKKYSSCFSEYNFFEKNLKNKNKWNNWKQKLKIKNLYYYNN